MDVPRFGAHKARQRLDVGAEQLLEGAVIEDFSHDGVALAQRFEHLLRRGVLPALGALGLGVEAQFAKEHLAHLSRRGDGEAVARQGVDLALDGLHALSEKAARGGQGPGVEAHAGALHVGQHGHEGYLDFTEDAPGAALLHLAREGLHEAQRDVGVFAGIIAHGGGREVGHVELPLAARTDELLDVDGAVVEVALGQGVHVVVQLGLYDVMGQHCVEHRAGKRDAVGGEHLQVVFQVLPHLADGGVLVDGAEDVDDALRSLACGGHGHVPGLAGLGAEA